MVGTDTLVEVRRRLEALYGARLCGVVLFGSEARGEAGPDSDIDLLVLLEGPVDRWRETRQINRALYEVELGLSSYRAINALPTDMTDYECESAPMYAAARREGLRI